MGRERGGRRELAAEVAELYPPQGEWREEDYFSLPDTNRYVELSEGRLEMPPHPTYRHQAMLLELYVRLRSFVEGRDLGQVLVAPLPVRLWPEKIREPDIFFISREHTNRISEQVCGVPDLVVEVTSPSTRQTDRVKKFAEYARAGVQEYWIVDPDKWTIEVYVLGEEGDYTLREKEGRGEVVHSTLLTGFEISVDEIRPENREV